MQTQPSPVPPGELHPIVRSVSLALFTQAAFGVLGLFLDIKILSSSGFSSALHGPVLLIFDILLAIVAAIAGLMVRQGTPQARFLGLGVGGLGVLLGIIVLLIESDSVAFLVFPQMFAAAVVLILLLDPSGGRAFTQPVPPGGLMAALTNLGGNKQQPGFGGYPQQGGYNPAAGGDYGQQPYYPGAQPGQQPTQVIPTYGSQAGQGGQPPAPSGGGWQPPTDNPQG